MKYTRYTIFFLFIMHGASNINSKFKKIGFFSSWNIPCGIAVYTKHLSEELQKKDYTVINYSHTLDQDEIIQKAISDNLDIFNIQYDVGLMPSMDILENIILQIKNAGIKIILTAHWEHHSINQIMKYLDLLIMHKPPTIFTNQSIVKIIPMGVPVFSPSQSRQILRKKYGYTEKDFIIVSTGFMLESKQPYLVLENLGPYIKDNSEFKLQLLHPISSRYPKNGLIVFEKIKNTIKKYGIDNQVTVLTNFLPQQELTERIYCSDIGYQWFKFNTLATSASAREYITAQTPLIIPNSSHFHDLEYEGIFKTPFIIEDFVDYIIKISKIPNLKRYREKLKFVYDQLNYNNIISQYLKILDELYEKKA